MDEPKKEKPAFDFSKADIFFSNAVNVSFNGEEFLISFGIKENRNDKREIIITHRAVISMPQFLKTYSLFSKFMKDLEEKKIIEVEKTDHESPKKVE